MRFIKALFILCLVISYVYLYAEEDTVTAGAILKSTDIKAGIAVHVGSGDGQLIAELVKSSNVYVHGLESNQAAVDKARTFLQKSNLYDRCSVEKGTLKDLPYIDNLINLLVINDWTRIEKQGLTLKEIIRVLVPEGVACLGKCSEKIIRAKLGERGIKNVSVQKSGSLVLIRKIRPKGMDDWTHVRHGPDANLFSEDSLVAPPKNIQWLAKPIWQGHFHGSPMVRSANGRLLYIIKENEITFEEYKAAVRAKIAAEKAKYRAAQKAKKDAKEAKKSKPPKKAEQPKKTSLWYLMARDAFNGRTLWRRNLKEGFGSSAFVADDDILYGVIKTSGPLVALDAATGKVVKTYEGTAPSKAVLHKGMLILQEAAQIRALDPKTGELKWQYKDVSWRGYGYRVTTFVVGDDKVFFLKRSTVACLNSTTGKKEWEVSASAWLPDWTKTFPKQIKVYVNNKVLLASYFNNVLLLAGRGGIHALSAKDGQYLWSRQHPLMYKRAYAEISCFDGLVWIHVGNPKSWAGLDPQTGKEVENVKYPKYPKPYRKAFGKGRCYPDKVTARYFITEEMCFLERNTGKLETSLIARGSCKIGYIPANGLLYAFPEQCGCYPMTRGIVALSATLYIPEKYNVTSDEGRLEKGAAYIERGTRNAEGKIGGRLFVGSTDTHQVKCIDEKTGKVFWMFTAGGRVPLKPTVHEGLCLFGSRDGWVYCLNAANGKLVWRFRAAPVELRMGAFNQLESPWPVNEVIIQNNTIYCSAGRHSKSEGGIQIYALAIKTGKIKWQSSPTKRVTLNGKLSIDGSNRLRLGRAAFDLQTGKCLK